MKWHTVGAGQEIVRQVVGMLVGIVWSDVNAEPEEIGQRTECGQEG